MWLLRKMLTNGEACVPEVFGWRKYGHLKVVCISLFPCETLREAWLSLTVDDKEPIQTKLREIFMCLRGITQSPAIIAKSSPQFRKHVVTSAAWKLGQSRLETSE